MSLSFRAGKRSHWDSLVSVVLLAEICMMNLLGIRESLNLSVRTQV